MTDLRMTDDSAFRRYLGDVFADEVAGTASSRHLDQIISATGRLRPLPRWLALLKEPPMRLNTRVAAGAPGRRLAIALAVVLALAVAAAAAATVLLRQNAPATEWSGFRGGPDRAGFAAEGPIGRPVLAWQLQLGAPPDNVSVVGDLAIVAAHDGTVHGVDRATGRDRWLYRATDEISAGPTVADGTVYVGLPDGEIVAIDGKTGVARWTSAVTALNPSSPAVADGLVVVAGADGLVALDAASGKERWRLAAPDGTPIHTPALASGRAFATTGGSVLLAVDAHTGQIAWQADLDGDDAASAVVSGGVVYAGVNADASDGHLHAFDARTGTLRWRIDAPFQAPAVARDVAYVASRDGVIAALRTADGSELWRVRIPGHPRAPAVAGGSVFVVSDDPPQVYALDAATGGALWQFQVDAASECCIAAADRGVFVATSSGMVSEIRGDGASLSPEPRHDLVATSGAPATEAPATVAPASPAPSLAPMVTLTWAAKAPAAEWNASALALAPDGNIWAADTTTARFSIFSPDGKFLEFWGTPGKAEGQFDFRQDNGDSYGTVAFEPDGSFFVLDVGNNRIQAFDASRRFVRAWGSFGSKPGQFLELVSLVVAPDGTLAVLDDARRVIERFDATGKVLSTFDAFPNASGGAHRTNSLAVDAAGNLYVSDIQPTQVDRFDPTGRLTMTYGKPGSALGEFSEQPGGMAIDALGRLFVDQGPQRGAAPAVQVFDPDGRFLGGFGAIGSGDTSVLWPSGMILVGGDLYLADSGDLENPAQASPRLLKFHLLAPFAP